MKRSPRLPLPAGFPKMRESHCMALSKASELERVEKMSVEERILLALSLREKLGELKPVPVANSHG